MGLLLEIMYIFKKPMYILPNTTPNTSVNGFRKVNVVSDKEIQIYDDDGITISNLTFKTFNQPRYIGINNLSNDVINVYNTLFTESYAVRVRIFIVSATQFKFSLNGVLVMIVVYKLIFIYNL